MDSVLGHVRWLGGGSGAGKSSVAQALSAACGVSTYSTDKAIEVHGVDTGTNAPLLEAFRQMTMDDRWLRRDPQTMLATFPWFAGERFDRIVEDLRCSAMSPLTIAEGFRLLPRLVLPLLAEVWQALWLAPTPEFRRTVFQRRPEQLQFWRGTSDPARALELLLERDAMFAETVSEEARALGLRVITIDGSRTENDVTQEVADWFRLDCAQSEV